MEVGNFLTIEHLVTAIIWLGGLVTILVGSVVKAAAYRMKVKKEWIDAIKELAETQNKLYEVVSELKAQQEIANIHLSDLKVSTEAIRNKP